MGWDGSVANHVTATALSTATAWPSALAATRMTAATVLRKRGDRIHQQHHKETYVPFHARLQDDSRH